MDQVEDVVEAVKSPIVIEGKVTKSKLRMLKKADLVEKEEFRKLEDLRSEFLKEFKMSRDEYDSEVQKTKGTILDFYYEMEEKYGKWAIKPKRVPKF